jgi:hypothetical protein
MEIACRTFLSIYGDIPGREVSPHLSLYFKLFPFFSPNACLYIYILMVFAARARPCTICTCSVCTGLFRLYNAQNGVLRDPRPPPPPPSSFADPFSKINDIREKTPRKLEKSQFGKKSAKVYLFSYL